MQEIKIIDKDEYWKLSLYPEIPCLRTDWRVGSYLDDATFQLKMEKIAEQVQVYQPVGFLANTLNFDYTITPEMQAWHNDLLFPIFEKEGLKKMAIVIPKDLFTQVSIEQAYDENTGLMTQFFDDEQKALEWIKD